MAYDPNLKDRPSPVPSAKEALPSPQSPAAAAFVGRTLDFRPSVFGCSVLARRRVRTSPVNTSLYIATGIPPFTVQLALERQPGLPCQPSVRATIATVHPSTSPARHSRAGNTGPSTGRLAPVRTPYGGLVTSHPGSGRRLDGRDRSGREFDIADDTGARGVAHGRGRRPCVAVGCLDRSRVRLVALPRAAADDRVPDVHDQSRASA